jgi:3-oxoacyl-[acyl-carrier protein] reductase
MDFSNKVVLITGASRGIGRACAVKFAQAGATVAVHYNTSPEGAEETVALLKGDAHITIGADMADANAVQAMVDKVVALFGRIDVLVNNAGIYDDHAPDVVDYETWQAQWQRIINVNLIGAANTAYCAAQHMIKQGGGRIVNVSSRGAFRGEPTAPAYGASKAGMNAMGQSLAKQLAPHNIFVGTVAPGFVETKMVTEHLKGEAGDAIRNQSPLKRVARADEVAHAVMFLASEGAEWTTGAILDCNGASYLRS